VSLLVERIEGIRRGGKGQEMDDERRLFEATINFGFKIKMNKQ
jgi:hypothetical protein